jgi:hypothetical protein
MLEIGKLRQMGSGLALTTGNSVDSQNVLKKSSLGWGKFSHAPPSTPTRLRRKSS